MRTTAVTTFLPALLLLSSYNSMMVDAFSSGAGGCEGNTAAAGGLHVDTSNNRPVMDGTFAAAAIEVMLDGVVITPGTPIDAPIQQDVMISVNALDVEYLGILIRLEAPSTSDTAGSLVPGANTQDANACSAPIVGITHMDSSEKSMSTGTLRFDTETLDVVLDISIVFFNGADGSAYAYDQFNVNFRQAGVPTNVPTVTPVATPVEPPAAVPVEPPVEPPASAPVEPPASAPAEPPASTPVEPPASAPVEPPASTPVDPPAVAPVEPPANITPTDEPTPEGTIAPPATEEPTIFGATSSPTDGKTSEPTPVVMEKTPKGKSNGKGKGGMMGGMMMMKGGGKGKGKGGRMMGKKSPHVATDDDNDDRSKHFLDEYIGHHSQSSEHLKELNFEIMEHITYEP